LFAANALVASSKASPRNRLFEPFIRNSFLLPTRNRGTGSGGLAVSRRGKCLPFPALGLQCCRRGSRQKSVVARPRAFAPGAVLIWPPNRVETVPRTP